MDRTGGRIPSSSLWLNLSLIFVMGLFQFAYAQQCQTVYQVQRVCVGVDTINITCPTKYFLVVTGSRFLRGLGPQCPPPAGGSECTEQVVTNVAKTQCQGFQSCTPVIPSPSTSVCLSSGYPGSLVLEIVYSCQAVQNVNSTARAIALCETGSNRQFTGSNINIDSDPLWIVNKVNTLGNCTCMLQLPAFTELQVTPLYYLKTNKPAGESACAQRIEIYDSYGAGSAYNICSTLTPMQNLGCTADPAVYRIKFVNSNPSVLVQFVMNFIISDFSNMTMTCGLTFSDVAPTTAEITTIPTTAAATTQPITTMVPTTVALTTQPPTTQPTTQAPTQAPTTPSPTTIAPTTSSPTTVQTTTLAITTQETTTEQTTTTPTTTVSTTTIPTTVTTTTVVTSAATTGDSSTVQEANGSPIAEKKQITVWPIIVGILGGAILLLLFCCIIVGLCYKNNSKREVRVQPDNSSDKGSQFTYVTEVYVDGDQKSRLVVGRPAIIQGSIRQFLN